MFDIFRSRDKAVRAFLIFLLGLVGLSMVTYLIPSSGTGGATGADTEVIAQIGSEKVTTQDITQAIRRMEQNRQLPAELLSIYAPQVIQQAINERVMAWKAAGFMKSCQSSGWATTNTLSEGLDACGGTSRGMPVQPAKLSNSVTTAAHFTAVSPPN